MAAKTGRQAVVPQEHEPKLTLEESKELLAVLWIESGHYRNVPSDYWTPDIKDLEYAKNRMSIRISRQEHPEHPEMYDMGAELMTKFEWQVVLRAVEMELNRLSVLGKECWTKGHFALMSAHTKILAPRL